MARSKNRLPDFTVEEFEAWSKASDRFRAVAERADERGGPALSLVPAIDQHEPWPTDLLPDADELAAATSPAAGASNDPHPAPAALPFDGVELPEGRNRLAGWSAQRQRIFLTTLAETGSVHLAADAARLSARSAYALRTRSPAFAAAWDTSLQLAAGRLSAIAFDRAINGRVEQVYCGHNLIGEKRVPNDRLLTWLLARLDPKRFALPWEQRGDADPQAEAVATYPALLDALADAPC